MHPAYKSITHTNVDCYLLPRIPKVSLIPKRVSCTSTHVPGIGIHTLIPRLGGPRTTYWSETQSAWHANWNRWLHSGTGKNSDLYAGQLFCTQNQHVSDDTLPLKNPLSGAPPSLKSPAHATHYSYLEPAQNSLAYCTKKGPALSILKVINKQIALAGYPSVPSMYTWFQALPGVYSWYFQATFSSPIGKMAKVAQVQCTQNSYFCVI